MLLLAVFAATAVLLGAVGIHGVLSYDVARRRREIGIRMALGAPAGGILRLIVGQGVVLTALALAIGAAGSFALTRFLGALLFGVEPFDPLTLIAVAAVMGLVGVAATTIPAWRATHTDPATALRSE
jgi:ABC-type antimicrobial peptide transport system permease subunit